MLEMSTLAIEKSGSDINVPQKRRKKQIHRKVRKWPGIHIGGRLCGGIPRSKGLPLNFWSGQLLAEIAASAEAL